MQIEPGEERRLDERRAVELFEVLFAAAADGVVLARPDGTILRANPAAEALLGRPEAELLRTGRAGVTVPTEELRRLIAERDRTGVARAEVTLRRGDGTTFAAEVTAVLLPGDARDRLSLVLFHDVTPARRALEALRRSEERFRVLAEAMPQIVCSIGTDGMPDYVNGRWTELSGLTAEETARAGVGAVFHPDDVPLALATLRRARDTRTAQEVELRYRARDGSHRWFLSRLAPVLDAAGRVVRFVGAAMDVDDRKRAAAERESLLAAVQEADREKNALLALLAHELRNPLAPIRNAVHLLELGADPERAARARAVILRQTEQLARLVDDLLDLTRVARGKLDLHRERLDLRELVLRACEDQLAAAQAAGVALRQDAPVAPAWVEADATRLAQVLGNLLQNALKFTPPGGAVEVTLEVGAETAIVRVRDTGAGVEAGELERMFEPFVQAERTRSRAHGGLGLGLALVKGLVEAHGGAVAAASEGPGRGTEVRVVLPLAAPPAVPSSRR